MSRAVVMDHLSNATREELEDYLDSRGLIVRESDSTSSLLSVVFFDLNERIDPKSPGFDADEYHPDDDGEYVALEVVDVAAATPTAIVVVLDNGSSSLVPKAVIHDESEVFDLNHSVGTLIVTLRFALRQGWV